MNEEPLKVFFGSKDAPPHLFMHQDERAGVTRAWENRKCFTWNSTRCQKALFSRWSGSDKTAL